MFFTADNPLFQRSGGSGEIGFELAEKTAQGRRQTQYFEGPSATLPLNSCIAAFYIPDTRKGFGDDIWDLWEI